MEMISDSEGDFFEVQNVTSALHLWPASACLVRELSTELLALSREELARALVVLPTKRLGNWLLAILAQRLGPYIPPKTLTFEEMTECYAPRPPEADTRVVTAFEDKQLLTQLIAEQTFRHLRPGHEHELLQLFTELVDWDLESNAYERLCAAAEGGARSEESLNTLMERIHEIEQLRRLRGTRLSAAKTQPANVLARARYRSLAEAIQHNKRFPGIDGNIYIVGLSSAKTISAPLFHALCRCPRVQLWISDPPPGLRRGPIERLIELCGVAPQYRKTQPAAATVIRAHAAESPLAEAAIAVALAQDAIASGCLPSHIALLVADDHAYAAPLRQALQRAGITANFAITTPLAQTRTGAWIAALTEVLSDDQDAQAQLGLLTHPLTRHWLRQAVPETEKLADMELDIALTEGLCRFPIKISNSELVLPTTESPSEAIDQLYGHCMLALQRLLLPLWSAPSASAQTLVEYARLWQETFEKIGLFDSTTAHESDDGITQSVQASLKKFFADLLTVDSTLTGSLTPRQFLNVIKEELLPCDVRSVGDQLRGIQVLSIEEARYVPFRLVIIVGCNEGRLPRALPKDRLIDNYLKTRMGLPGWQLLEGIEDTTFQLLAARVPQLRLLYAERDGKDELVRSRFIEAFLAQAQAQLAAPLARTVLQRVIDGDQTTSAMPKALPVDGDEGRLAGTRDELTRFLSQFSATSLEALLLCPYRYLLRRLGVKPLELPDESKSKEQGELLHAILEAFFTARDADLTPLPGAHEWAGFESKALQRLLELTERIAGAEFLNRPLFRHLRGFAWPAFATHLKEIHTPETWRSMVAHPLRELRFGADRHGPVQITVNGRKVAFTGAIDAIDPADGMTVVTDYKTRGSPDRQLAANGLVPQLPIYAQVLAVAGQSLAHTEFRVADTVVGYWSIVKGEWIGLAAGSAVLSAAKAKKLIGGRTKQTLDDVVAQLFAHWQWRDTNVLERDQAFRADPSVCGFCRYAGICRKDDPRWAEVMNTRRELKERLAPSTGNDDHDRDE